MTIVGPLLLLPGLICDEVLWAHQIQHLSDVAAVSVGDLTQGESIAAMADDVLAVAPERFALAGFSTGGYVSLEIMRRVPERVTRLALLNTSARPDDADKARKRQELIAQSSKGKFRGMSGKLMEELVYLPRAMEPSLLETVSAMTQRMGQAVFVRQQVAVLGRLDSRDTLAAIDVPTMVICGREDALTPLPLHEEMVAGIKGARLAVVEECGHLSPLERPHAVTALLRTWLLHD
ncbi:MAG: alpha/beta fold hydrolase [Alphaproteobacteria bacterium]